MAFWDGSMTPAMKKWRWENRRVWNPFRKCERSGEYLFLKKAYYGRYYVDWEYDHDTWLSEKEYLWKVLKET